MKKRWILKKAPDSEATAELSKSINVNTYLAGILVQRGIRSFEDARFFFRPGLDSLHDPFKMKDMEKAVNRLCKAISKKERILLYGDYDVDGTTAVSLLYLFLKGYTDRIGYYIPDRQSEGYGISKKGMDHAVANGYALIIALDCGIRARERAGQARESGIDLIICDHHLPGEILPDAFAILNPKQEGCPYPFRELSGCGVGFKLLEGFCRQNAIDRKELFSYLDIVAVSIASDLVPITGENRILAYHGLKKLNEEPCVGLKSLIKVSGIKAGLHISDIVFKLGPRINAAGRIAHANESVELFIGKSEKYANSLNERNTKRKAIDKSTTQEALEMIAAEQPDKRSTVLFKDDWHKGVIGIVASRCIEQYYRPTIILAGNNGKAVGSARSVDGFDIHKALSECDDLLEKYGGHAYAAGLTLTLDKIEAFQGRFEEVVSRSLTPEQLLPKIEIDIEIPLKYLHFKAHRILAQIAPFGPGNPFPLFGTKNVVFEPGFRIINDQHVKGFLHQGNEPQKHEFIAFGLAGHIKKIMPGRPLYIAYHLEENNYLARRTLILNIKDIRYD